MVVCTSIVKVIGTALMVPAETRVVHASAFAHHAHLLAVVVAVLPPVIVLLICGSRAASLVVIVRRAAMVAASMSPMVLLVVVAPIRVVSVLIAEVALVAASTPASVPTAIATVVRVVVVATVATRTTFSAIIAIIVVVSVVVEVVTSTAAATPTPIVMMVPIVVMVVTIAAAPMVVRVVSLRVRVCHEWPVCVLHMAVLIGTAAVLGFATGGGLSCVLANLVTDLSSSSTAAKLPMRLKSVVPVDADDAPVEHGAIQGVHSDSCLRPSGILNEAEATGLHLDAVQPHDKVNDLATGGKKLEQLAL